jgi:hypothetical protein
VVAQRDREAGDGEDVVHRPRVYHPGTETPAHCFANVARRLRRSPGRTPDSRKRLANRVPHLRAALVALVALLLLCAGAPGFDYISPTIQTAASIERAVEDAAAWARPFQRAALTFELRVRRPLARELQPIERFFRIAQSWHLYRNGPGRVARLEIWADATLLHRSLDDEHAWLEPVLRSRRVRPVAEAVVSADGGRSEVGFTRFVVSRVLAERPDTNRVELRAIWSPWPGDKPKLHHTFVAEAPDWKVVRR